MYTLKARVYPFGIVLLPIIILGILYSFQFDSILKILSSLGVTAVFLFILSQFSRDAGKKKEIKLWEGWGGAPTSQVLSYSNITLDINTKIKYHHKLKKMTNIGKELDEKFEKNNKIKSFDIYKSWTKYLISKTRDTKRYKLLFTENINYGFRRNLWGLKPFAITLLIITIFGNYLYQIMNYGQLAVSEYSIEYYFSELSLILLLLVWIFVINKNWIKTPAFAYAERLLESINNL